MKEGYTHIAVVLDSSGSMGYIFNDTVAGKIAAYRSVGATADSLNFTDEERKSAKSS